MVTSRIFSRSLPRYCPTPSLRVRRQPTDLFGDPYTNSLDMASRFEDQHREKEKDDIEFRSHPDASIKPEAMWKMPNLTTSEKRKLLIKLDLRIMPICLLLYFINVLNRTAVGNAAACELRHLVLTPQVSIERIESRWVS
jgi:hypothetical protein